jgi:hypothetical protein
MSQNLGFQKCIEKENERGVQITRGYRPGGDITVLEILAQSAICEGAVGDGERLT